MWLSWVPDIWVAKFSGVSSLPSLTTMLACSQTVIITDQPWTPKPLLMSASVTPYWAAFSW